MNLSVRVQQVCPVLVGSQSIATQVFILIHAAWHSSTVEKSWGFPKYPWASFVLVQHAKFSAIQNKHTKCTTTVVCTVMFVMSILFVLDKSQEKINYSCSCATLLHVFILTLLCPNIEALSTFQQLLINDKRAVKTVRCLLLRQWP